MKDIILKRIEEIKKSENGFDRRTMKWKNPISNGIIVKHADEINFTELSDNDLIFLFERIIRRVQTPY